VKQAGNFRHEAMKTTFSLILPDEGPAEAGGLARECFEHLDYLESRLSRYIEGSDVWQINHMEAGDQLFLSEACHKCLLQAREAQQLTEGRFDVSLGTIIEHQKTKVDGPPVAVHGCLVIDPDRPLVTCEEAGREIDLGGIGKGFALDSMGSLLKDWGVKNALLSAGASTHLAVGTRPWKLALSGDHQSLSIEILDRAMSASGTAFEGMHLVTATGSPTSYPCKRAWAVARTAAIADAWSTALMLLTKEEIHSLKTLPEACYLETAEGIHPVLL
jgi:thiamine biosynthesis lipoprotein